MEELIKLANIDIDVDVTDWQDAITKAGVLLEKSGSIHNTYIDKMINSVKTLGPYIVLMPGLALAHAEPCSEVINNDLSLITLRKPVSFGSINDPVRVVMCMSCVDKQTHIATLQKVAIKLMQNNTVEKMLTCTSKEELYSYINS